MDRTVLQRHAVLSRARWPLHDLRREMAMMTLGMYQRGDALAGGLREGIDFIAYEAVPLDRSDLVLGEGNRWVDRRTTDGELLAADGRNAK